MKGINERYALFLKTGGGKNHEYICWIMEMKKLYRETHPEMISGPDTIIDHDHFTDFIRDRVNG